jgi:ribosomal protection tetracycline resistance protein
VKKLEILIDGYNLMWASENLGPIAKLDFNTARDYLQKILNAYAKTTNDKIILVLDGYKSQFPYTRREAADHLEIILTARGTTADRWIMDTVAREGFEGTVVSSDHEIADFSRRKGATVVTSKKFEGVLLEAIKNETEFLKELSAAKKSFQKRRIKRR